VAITPDGTRAVSGSGNDLQVWDLATGREQVTLTGHTGEVFSVAVTPDATLAVSGSADGSVRIWNPATGREQAALTGHISQVFSVAITPDGTRAVSGGEDGSVRVWDLSISTEVARWIGDYPIIGCTALADRPLKIGVGPRQGPPFLLELRGTPGWRDGETPGNGGQRGSQPVDGVTIGAGGGHHAV
jgi:WD40 repeat protein